MGIFKKKDKKRTEIYLREVLKDVVKELKKHGTYIYNEPGSGDVDYIINSKTFSFNEFPEFFTGFYINSTQVSITQFLKHVRKEGVNYD